MALEQIQLDNLTWAEMVTSIRRRIPAASAGEWTLHAPVDPGVTLLELFAYLLEQRVYWLDQIPDSLVHAALSLMGESVRPATPASTVLQFSPREAAPFSKLPALTPLRLARSVPPLVFSIDEDVLLLPCAEVTPGSYRIGFNANGLDRTLDLKHERPICLLPADANEGDVKIVLYLLEELPSILAPNVFGEFFSLLVDLVASETIPPQWSSSAVADVQPPAKLTWWYPNSSQASLKQFSVDAVQDGTGGLRRSGVVRLKLPLDWQRESFDPSLPGLWPYSVTLRIEEGTFTSPPVVRRILPNVAIARHRRQTNLHGIKASWLPLPENKLVLSELSTAGLQDHPPLDDSIELSMSERDGEFDWELAQTLTFRGPDERVFTVDREMGLLRFGNGVTGRVPVVKPEDPNIALRYFVGGGEAGNIGSNLRFEGVADAQVSARNIVPAEGGAETESLESARRRAASALRRVDRAITPSDYINIVTNTPGVAFKRAYAALGHHPAHPCQAVPGAVTVYVVPDAPREDGPEYDRDCAYVAAPKPDQGALQEARARIEKARLIGSEVFVAAPEYRRVSLAVAARGDPADPAALSEKIRIGLQKFLDPLRGGNQKNGWPFGEPLRPSVLLSEAQRAAGLDASITSVAIGLDCEPASENCKDVEIKPHELVVLHDVVVTLQPDVSTQGGLR